ncbi:LysR family transcriptional regulator [Thalassospira sp. HF15]|uniref:LysR family transcriptional regulator n=1 Tax=Thalassospira sp. HF15 TaxID=2722755 RepID=UPI001431BCA0|nr:LysR family transcriptional regulator [Thalassospira sp. HF15]NIY75969.1 LysR family transcriptional regulator [Thalassospira sp. HF15]
MEKNEPDWNLYRTFLAVMECGSLSAAARVLGLTQPTVGRHVDELQDHLGVVLFTRSQAGLVPTDTAISLLPHATAVQSAARGLRRAASGDVGSVRGTVRVTAAEVVGIEILPPVLTQLRRDHPDLEIELVLSNRVENLLRRDADIAVRMVAPEQGALIAKHIGNIDLGFHAMSDYLDHAGWRGREGEIGWDQLGKLDLIGFDTVSADVRAMVDRMPEIANAHFAMRVDSNVAQLAMMRAGFGVAACQLGLARRTEGCMRLLPDFTLALDTWVTMHEGLRDHLRCRVVFDALVAGMQAYRRESLNSSTV